MTNQPKSNADACCVDLHAKDKIRLTTAVACAG